MGRGALSSLARSEATNQEAKELSAGKKLSPATTKKLGKDSLLVSEHEVRDLSFLSIRWGEGQTFLFEGWGSSTLSS